MTTVAAISITNKYKMRRTLNFDLWYIQVDASILITANVPSAKKIIIHGPQEPDDGAIPSQFPISEDVQFCQLQQEATDFFGIEEEKMDQFFLVDHKTSMEDYSNVPFTKFRDLTWKVSKTLILLWGEMFVFIWIYCQGRFTTHFTLSAISTSSSGLSILSSAWSTRSQKRRPRNSRSVSWSFYGQFRVIYIRLRQEL